MPRRRSTSYLISFTLNLILRFACTPNLNFRAFYYFFFVHENFACEIVCFYEPIILYSFQLYISFCFQLFFKIKYAGTVQIMHRGANYNTCTLYSKYVDVQLTSSYGARNLYLCETVQLQVILSSSSSTTTRYACNLFR